MKITKEEKSYKNLSKQEKKQNKSNIKKGICIINRAHMYITNSTKLSYEEMITRHAAKSYRKSVNRNVLHS